MGEVLAASDRLRERGLSERGFHALIAIAEKALTDTRQGSVRWDHIRAALYGASLRTAERAVQDLKRAGVVTVVRPGFNNNHGRAAAPIYEIQALTDPATMGDGIAPVDNSTDSDTQVAESVGGDPAKPGGRSRQIGDRSRHSGVGLDVSIDGSLDGARERKRDCCDEGGWILGPDLKTPIDPATHCSHRRCVECGTPLRRDTTRQRDRCHECELVARGVPDGMSTTSERAS